jgi:membrane protease YdiL (CAAX protease family)
LEEYYWRWYVYGELRRGVPPGIALVVSGLAFSSHHVIILAVYLPGEYFWTLTMGLSSAVAFGGIFWAWLYQRTRTLLGPWLSHALVDAGLMCVGYDLLFA